MFERIVFALFAMGIIGVLIFLTYKSRSKKVFACILVAMTGILSAFYLFQFGSLGSFSMKAFSTEASFIKEKKEQVMQDVKEINQIQANMTNQAKSIEGIVDNLRVTEKQVEESKTRILAMEQQVQEAATLAKPVTLRFRKLKTTKTNKGLSSLIYFQPTKDGALGPVMFRASLPIGSRARLLSFGPSLEGGAFASGDLKGAVAADGMSAQFDYAPMGTAPVIEMTVSEPTAVRVESSKLPEPTVINIKQE